MQWGAQQEQALKAVTAWLADKSKDAPQVFRLFGYAGTGKSTIANEIAQSAGTVLFAAFTGKAALVMRQKGCPGASTIHSLIYRIEDSSTNDPVFVLNRDSEVRWADLVVIDEVSMVDADLGRDLLSFGTKVLVLGDREQLQPVKGAGFFTAQEPDVMLTEIHRQAADNPIIRLSMDVREGRPLQPGVYGTSRIITRDQVDQDEILNADQVLVGLNRTRHAYNRRIRQLQGCQTAVPLVGDKLVCLRNDKDKSLLNGGLWEVAKVQEPDAMEQVAMEVVSLDDPGTLAPVRVRVPMAFFTGREDELDWRVRRNADEFCYGYALTVHKSQGSQWNHIVAFDESRTFREDARRWLYTAVTRAADRITLVAA